MCDCNTENQILIVIPIEDEFANAGFNPNYYGASQYSQYSQYGTPYYNQQQDPVLTAFENFFGQRTIHPHYDMSGDMGYSQFSTDPYLYSDPPAPPIDTRAPKGSVYNPIITTRFGVV